jgi:hypothetical protein
MSIKPALFPHNNKYLSVITERQRGLFNTAYMLLLAEDLYNGAPTAAAAPDDLKAGMAVAFPTLQCLCKAVAQSYCTKKTVLSAPNISLRTSF